MALIYIRDFLIHFSIKIGKNYVVIYFSICEISLNQNCTALKEVRVHVEGWGCLKDCLKALLLSSHFQATVRIKYIKIKLSNTVSINSIKKYFFIIFFKFLKVDFICKLQGFSLSCHNFISISFHISKE